MTVRVYRSTDASAPVLSGTTSSLIDMLHACLVVGYGAISAAGWTRSFFDDPNDVAVFRQGGGSSMYLRVGDKGPGAGTFKEARAVGYETMSGVDTGTGPFPTAAQLAVGVIIRKSTTADATARAWTLVASERLFFLFTFTGDTANTASVFSFGDVKSFKPSDVYNCRIAGRSTENAGFATGESAVTLSSAYSGVLSGTYLARSYTGVGGSISAGQTADYFTAPQTAIGGTGGVAYPSPVDGGLLMVPVGSHEVSNHRGVLPGLWAPLHANAFSAGDTIAGAGGLLGRTFENVLTVGGQVLVETSNTWDEV